MTTSISGNLSDGNRWTDQVDKACDRFEGEFRSQLNPQIESFLSQFPVEGRQELLRELIPLEIELLRETGGAPSLADYAQRFSEYGNLIEELEKETLAFLPSGTLEEIRLRNSSHDSQQPSPSSLDHFELKRVIGQGGFGTVWEAVDTHLQRDVAIKIPRMDRIKGQELSMFLREARAAARLKHPNIVAVHEVGGGKENSTAFIVTDLIDGPSLKVWLYTNKLSFHKAAELVARIAFALQHAHENNVIHRDVKPANILMDKQGQPHLVDFGLAKRNSSDESPAKSGSLLGTPTYMAPEQAGGHHDLVDQRTDLYALGVIFYECLTGRTPFRGELTWLLEQIQNVPPVPPRKIDPSIPLDLELVCLKCLAKAPQDRYQCAAELEEDLNRFLNGETLRGVPIPLPRRITKWGWRNRRAMLITLATSVVCLGTAGVIWWQSQPVVLTNKVELTTDPPGCRITAIMLDPKTGEPDPSKIRHARGKTPLTMPLPVGAHLIVAVLDDQRFHEVTIDVPENLELPRIINRGDRYLRAEHGILKFAEPISIPRPDVTAKMAFIEGTADWIPPATNIPLTAQEQIQIPAFYVDLQEIPQQDISKDSNENSYDLAAREVDNQGKRLPSAMEMLYLLSLKEAASQKMLPPARAREIELLQGLNVLPWEWTSTKPPSTIGKELGNPGADLQYRIGYAGSPILELRMPKNLPKIHSARIISIRKPTVPVSVRGVRSARPRTRPEDFIRFTMPTPRLNVPPREPLLPAPPAKQ